MRTYILLFAISVGLIATSCKKNYTCVCSNFPSSTGMSSKVRELDKSTKSDAETVCKNIKKSYYSYPSVTCEIK